MQVSSSAPFARMPTNDRDQWGSSTFAQYKIPALLRTVLLIICFCTISVQLLGQCPNNNVLVGTAVSPVCSGTTLVPCVRAGQYALVNVLAGNVYTFSTCGSTVDTEITLYNNAGGASLAYNDDFCGSQSTVTWTATFTGLIRVLVDIYPCASITTCSPLTIGCSGTVTSSDCVYVLTLNDAVGNGWGTSFVGVSVNGGPYTNYTVTGATNQILIGVNAGDIVRLSYNNSGVGQIQNSFNLRLQGPIIFNSGTMPAAGIRYVGTVTCEAPPQAQEDCIGAFTICSDVTIANNTNNTGNFVDINATNHGCLDPLEHQGTWYTFSPSVGGDLGFSITPTGAQDYDWAVWGPYPQGTMPSSVCPPVGPPIRCAGSSAPATFASTGSYATGMGHATFSPPRFAPTTNNYALPFDQGSCPLSSPQRCGWVSGMQVVAGQVFLMYISNWSSTSTAFNLNWTLENNASLDCTVLPVRWLAFEAELVDTEVALHWTTASVQDNDHFDIERSQDGIQFEPIGAVPAVGFSQGASHYEFLDRAPHTGLNYYRIRQVDLDGTFSFSQIRVIDLLRRNDGILALPNPGSGLVDIRLTDIGSVAFLSVLDATGREVLRRSVTSDHIGFDASSLASGSYVLRAISSDGHVIAHGRWMHE